VEHDRRHAKVTEQTRARRESPGVVVGPHDNQKRAADHERGIGRYAARHHEHGGIEADQHRQPPDHRHRSLVLLVATGQVEEFQFCGLRPQQQHGHRRHRGRRQDDHRHELRH